MFNIITLLLEKNEVLCFVVHIFLHIAIQYEKHNLLKRLSFVLCVFMAYLSKIGFQRHARIMSMSSILFYCLLYKFFVCANLYDFISISLVIQLEIRDGDTTREGLF